MSSLQVMQGPQVKSKRSGHRQVPLVPQKFLKKLLLNTTHTHHSANAVATCSNYQVEIANRSWLQIRCSFNRGSSFELQKYCPNHQFGQIFIFERNAVQQNMLFVVAKK